ncbi:MAG: DUF6067 family protein [Verrucomicrobiae bacterium]|nr:DUF6067 family protein [Verrucomicrobiae bacterium]
MKIKKTELEIGDWKNGVELVEKIKPDLIGSCGLAILLLVGIIMPHANLLAQETRGKLAGGAGSHDSGEKKYVYLSDIKEQSQRGSFAELGKDGFINANASGRRDSLILADRVYAKGLWMHSVAETVYFINGNYEKFSALIGIGDETGDGGSVVFKVVADGRVIYNSGIFTRKRTPEKIDLNIAGVEKLALLLGDAGDGIASDHGIWADAVLLEKNGDLPLSSGMPVKRERVSCGDPYLYKFAFPVPFNKCDFVIVRKNYLDEIDPAQLPEEKNMNCRASIFATPGEYEPMSLVIYALQDLNSLSIHVEDLRRSASASVIPAKNIQIRSVIRCLEYQTAWRPPSLSKVVSRFLPLCKGLNMKRNQFREFFLIIKVPDESEAGIYEGDVIIRVKNEFKKVRIALEVLPFKLAKSDKTHGVFHKFSLKPEDLDKTRMELRDIKEHGISTIGADLYFNHGSQGRVDDEEVVKGLSLLREFGFAGPVHVGAGLCKLATQYGYDLTGKAINNAGNKKRFEEAARKTMEKYAEIQDRFREFEILALDSDEILRKDRLPVYLYAVETAKQYDSNLKWINFLQVEVANLSLLANNFKELHSKIAPYIDRRVYNGWQLDQWLGKGHGFEELAALMKAGDESGFYYNIIGHIQTPKRRRIIDGLFLWMSPMKSSYTWCYHRYYGNPFDEFDGNGHDAGLAFPSADDNKTPVPTKCWEAVREGIDDARYFRTLETVIEEAGLAAEANAVRKEFEKIKLKYLNILGEVKMGGNADPFDSRYCPCIYAMDRKISSDELQQLRYEIAQYIILLKRAGDNDELEKQAK